MNKGYESIVKPQFNLLSKKDIQYIHTNALKILKEIGVRVDHDEGEKLLLEHDCQKLENGAISLPVDLVETCLKSIPSEIQIFNQKGKDAMLLGGRNNYFGTGTDLLKTYDLRTGEYRLTVLQDVANAAIVSDYCKEVDFVSTMGLPSDVHQNLSYIENVKTLLYNTTKPIFFTAAGKEDLEVIFKMASEVAGGRENLQEKPFMIHYSEPTAPLSHTYGAVQKLFLCADEKLPICYVPGDILGASCPVTLAGGITQAIAEALSGIVLHQLRNKGSPIISGFGVVPLDMRTAIFCYGAPEFRLTNSAFADMLHYYNIPMWSTVGADTFSLDPQAGFEHGFGTLMAALDGAHLIHDIGYMGQGLLSNPAAIVMSNEIIGSVRRILRGFKLNDDKIGLETIKKVTSGSSGSFLSEVHTLNHFRKEFWMPQLSNRLDYETWIKEGKKSYTDLLIAKTLEILETHRPEPLAENVRYAIETLLKEVYPKLKNIRFKA
ncbi:MAG: trimethylamine methyltransferase family protein [Candidatus Hermodarchaeota archaeon]